MVTSRDIVHEWMNNPKNIGAKECDELHKLILEYPYCQSTRLLYLLGLKNENSLSYNKQLKTTAAYASDRVQLFYLVTESENRQKELPKSKKAPSTTTNEKLPKNHLKLGEPIAFGKEEKHSFNEWLTLSQVKPIERVPKADKQSLESKIDLIEEFVNKDRPRPEKERFFSPSIQAKKSLDDQMTFVTETLARVYLEQGNYEKAKIAYKQLSLKYPKKSSFFAAQIELVDKLIKQK